VAAPRRDGNALVIETAGPLTARLSAGAEFNWEGARARPATFVIADPNDPPGGVDAAPTDATLTLVPRGYGEAAWTRRSPPNTVERSIALLGSTADAGRVIDAAACCNLWSAPVRLWGRRQNGVIAAYAALLSDKVEEVVLVDPPASHMQGPHFMGVLRVCDIPDALGALAPRKLTIVTKTPEAFAKTRAIYKAAGVEDRLSIK
jgi:pimeloyl-ACP methyl ester carboxylesterase